MSIVNDRQSSDNSESDLADSWNPESDGESWEPDGLDDPISWLPTDVWIDRQADIYEARGNDVSDFVAGLLRRTAKEFRALDAATVEEFLARSATYPL
jgi:hypothetical protein